MQPIQAGRGQKSLCSGIHSWQRCQPHRPGAGGLCGRMELQQRHLPIYHSLRGERLHPSICECWSNLSLSIEVASVIVTDATSGSNRYTSSCRNSIITLMVVSVDSFFNVAVLQSGC